jgi:hypothetical protein
MKVYGDIRLIFKVQKKIVEGKTILRIFCIALLTILISACSSQRYRFADADPVERDNDMRSVPVPKATRFERVKFGGEAMLRRPISEGLRFSGHESAMDVNSMDEVPASSWFTPRLGYVDISPEELLKGPEHIGPPQLPITVSRAKVGGGNPGFIIKDSREKLYLVKFDPPEFPAIETTTATVVNRLFWGFGYNVPEDYLFHFRKEDFRIEAGGELTQEDVDKVLNGVAAPVDGRYRTTVSLLIDGIVLGPVSATGVRQDDPNDKIPHEDRRILRALRVFSAFTNHSDIRIDNSLDVYVGEPGKGYVRHYLLDFGEAFGGHGAEHNYLWDGFHHIFSFGDAFKGLVTLGLDVKDWEKLEFSPWKSVGAFESEVFKAESWKEVWPYVPIRNSRPADDYWAAKILGAIREDHIKTLVYAAQYPEEGAAEYVIKTLLERQQKILEYFLNQVTAVDAIEFSGGALQLKDVGMGILGLNPAETQYEIRFYNGKDEEVNQRQIIKGNVPGFSVPIPESLVKEAGGYLRVDVLVWRGTRKAPAAANFHLRESTNSTVRLVGVVH